jgi:hypothetical protein
MFAIGLDPFIDVTCPASAQQLLEMLLLLLVWTVGLTQTLVEQRHIRKRGRKFFRGFLVARDCTGTH